MLPASSGGCAWASHPQLRLVNPIRLSEALSKEAGIRGGSHPQTGDLGRRVVVVIGSSGNPRGDSRRVPCSSHLCKHVHKEV